MFLFLVPETASQVPKSGLVILGNEESPDGLQQKNHCKTTITTDEGLAKAEVHF
jgi:hypothetical protein